MIIAVDVGTSSIKVGLIDEKGVLSTVVYDIPLLASEVYAAEHDLEYIWRVFLEGLRRISRGFEDKVEALVFSNYLHGLALLDEKYSIVRNVMTHLDRRCSLEQRILEETGYTLYRRTGCPPIFVFPLCKILWLRKRGLFNPRSHKLSFVKDYILYKLTGVHAVDHGVASGTGLQNIHSLNWDDLALEIAGIDETNLPELVEGSRVIEYVDVKDTGLKRVAVVPGSFDGALQNIGYGVFEENAVLNLGSTAVVRTITRDIVLDKSNEMRFFAYYAVDGYRTIGGASNNGMTVIEWLKKIIGEVVELQDNPVCTDGVYVLPFISGERYPFRDPDLTFSATGIRLEHTRKHLWRGVLEGIAFTVGYIVKAIEESGKRIETLYCAGGGCLNPEIARVFADVICKPLVVYEVAREAGLLGAALVALKATGELKTITDRAKFTGLKYEVIEPRPNICENYKQCFPKYLELVKTLQRIIPK